MPRSRNRPAAAGWSLDDGLADLILHELGGTAEGQHPAAALPLLSHVLQETWKNRAGNRLTVSGYRATGGIARAIATTAENVYDQLDQDGREAVRLMLPRLVRVGEGVADTAQPVRRSALLHGLPDTEVAQGAIKQLADARLLTLERDTVRISHEALLREWPELQTWVDADRDWLRARQQLADGAVAWQRSGRDPSLLYRGNRLNTLRELAAQTPARTADLDPGLAEFMGASWRQERRGARVRRIAVAILTALAVLATAGLVGVVVFQRQAEQARQRNLARYLAAEAEDLRDQQPGLAKQLSLLAYQINHDAGRGALLNSQRTPGVINAQEAAHDLAYSADGRVLAISTGDSIVLRAGSNSGRIRADAVGPIAVSHDGRTLSAVTYSSRLPNTATVRLWDISDPVHPRQTAALNENHAVTALALSTDGSTLFGGVSTGAILVWNISDRSTPTALPPLPGHSKQVDSLAVSPRRGLLASLSVDGRILLWNVADPGHPHQVGALTASPYTSSSVFASPLHRLAFDRTGLLLAAPVPVKSGDALGLWRLDDPRAPRRIPEDSSVSPDTCFDSLTSLAFSPAHDQLVGLCGEDWHAWLYSTDSDPGVIVSGTSMTVQGSSTESGTVVFDPSKSRRLLQTTDRGVLVWYLSNAAQPGASDFVSLTPGTGGQMAFRAAGRNELLAVQGFGVNDLVDVTPGREKRLLATTPAPDMFTGSGIALSPDGSILADIEVYPGTKPKTQNVGVRLRDTAHPTGPPLATIGDELVDGVQSIAFSPTRPLLAVSDLNGWNAANRSTPKVRLFDISDPRHPRQVGSFTSTSPRIAFSPDGRTLVTEEAPLGKPKDSWLTTGVRLVGRDLTDPAHPTTLWTQQLKPDVDSADLAFRPDGKLLAAYQSNGTLLLWHVDGQRPTGAPVSVTIGEYGGPIAFTPDGTRLALIDQNITTDASEGDRPEIWDLSDPDDPVRESYLPMSPVSSLYALAYSPNGRLLAILRASAGVDLWDTTPDPVISDLCNAVGDPITRQQWKRYLPDRLYQPPCPPGQ
ncbi:nSTAND1 domain-containing NTPase [Streptacidiphilus sp. PAMC 29251]